MKLENYLRYDKDSGAVTRVSDNKKLGSKDVRGYLETSIKGTRYKVHRLAWYLHYGSFPNGVIDHINGIKDDNRICNLRSIGQRENCHNQERHRNGKLVGASWNKVAKKYEARVRVGKVRLHLGCFNTEIEAHNAYMSKLKELGFIK